MLPETVRLLSTLAVAAFVSLATASAQDNAVYWIGADGDAEFNNAIYAYDLDAGVVDTLVQARSLGPDEFRAFVSFDVDVPNDRVYWTETGGTRDDGVIVIGAVGSSALDGSDVQTLYEGVVCGVGTTTDIEVAGDSLYWGMDSACPDAALTRAGAGGPSETDPQPRLAVLSGYFVIQSLEVDPQRETVYWANYDIDFRNPAGLYSAPLRDTSSDQLLVRAPVLDFAIDHASSEVYWTPFQGNVIRRANLDGSGATDVVVSDETVRYLALDRDGGKVYWTETEAGRIRRANLDGTDVEDVLVGLSNPMRIRLGFGGGFVSSEGDGPSSDRETLRAVYPNPFRDETTVAFDLDAPSAVRLEVFDVLGRRVDVMDVGSLPAGPQSILWRPGRIAPGAYHVVLTVGGEPESTRVTVWD